MTRAVRRLFPVICLASFLPGACTPSKLGDLPLSPEERTEIGDSVRARVLAFAEMQMNHAALCADVSPMRDHFAYPGGRILTASDTTASFITREEWEEGGIPQSYWCSIQSMDVRYDSIYVHVLTRDVAVSFVPFYVERVLASGDSAYARGSTFETWLRTDTGWKSTSSSGHMELTEPR